jgi:hypothetical protein
MTRASSLPLLALLWLSACTSPVAPSTTPQATTSEPTAQPTIDLTDPSGDLYFPVHTSPDLPMALAEGTLVLEDGCLLLKWPDGQEDLILWPAWVQPAGPPLSLSDSQSGEVADIDGPIKLGGGQFRLAQDAGHIRKLLSGGYPPERCAREHYWLASGIMAR